MTNKARDETQQTFVFLSEILDRKVVSSQEKVMGKVVDLRIKLGMIFPAVVSVRIRQKADKKLVSFPWHAVDSINGKVVRLKKGVENQRLDLNLEAGEILLRDEILDDQVLDTYGAKVERVNDLHLLLAEGQLRVVHVDFGIRGIFRRLGWLRFVDALTSWLFDYKIPKRLLSWKYIQPLSPDPKKKTLKLNVTHRKLSEIHPPDLADILEELDRHERSYVFRSLDVEAQADALEEVDDKTRVSIIEALPEERASDVLEEMEPDEAVDLLQDLPDEKQQELIRALEKEKRQELRELLEFEEETAGGIMTTGYVSCLHTDSIRRVTEIFRQSDDPLDNISYVYVTDEDGKLVGVITLRNLILCSPETQVSSLMKRDVVKLKVNDSLDQVADTFRKYKFLTIPVVDEQDRMEGIITLRDGVEAIFPEFGE
ncbi:MAG: CBS domain-containing protein [candidate division Zixibacteria bacterium]|nr:CBS domain-containing protein [candidate division Zixibacteria bacterium]